MSVEAFVHFDGECREAVTFYAGAFGVPVPPMVTYGDMPDELPAEYAGRIAYTRLALAGGGVMFSDGHPGWARTPGDTISLTIIWHDRAAVYAWFERLSRGGQVHMPLQKTSWAEGYGMLTDKFGVPWHFSLEPGAA